MQAPDLVSVIVPVYNGEKTIEACLASILGQDHRSLEVVVIDDGSTDATGPILDRLAAENGRLKVRHIANGGVSAARNLALDICSGAFILFVDADDTLADGAIKALYAGHCLSGAPLVIGGFDRFDSSPLNSPDSLVFPTDRLLAMPAIVSYVSKYLDRPNRNPLFVTTWGRLIRADIVKDNDLRFNEEMRTMEDVQFNFQLLAHVDRLYYVARRLYNYRIYSGSASQTILAVGHRHGLTGFVPALETARGFLLAQTGDRDWTNRWIGQAYVTYTIVHLVRLCVSLNRNTFQAIKAGCQELVNIPQLADCIGAYVPAAGDSVLLPRLIRERRVLAIMTLCKYKAWRRYGRKRK